MERALLQTSKETGACTLYEVSALPTCRAQSRRNRRHKGDTGQTPLGDGLRGDGKAENLSLAEGIGFLDGEDKGIGGLGDTKGVLCFSQMVLAACLENAHVFVLTDFVAENGSHVSVDEEGNIGGAGLGEWGFDFAVNGVFGSRLSVYIVGVDNRQAFGVWQTEGEYRGDSLTEERIGLRTSGIV